MTEKRNVRRISLFITFFIVLCTIIGIIPINTAHAATIYGFVPENFWWDIDSEGNAAIMGVNLGTAKGDIKIPTTLAGGQGPYYIASGTTSPGGSYVGTSGKTYKVTKIHGGYGMYASGEYYTEFGAFSPLSPVNAGNCYANNITGVQFPAQGTIISTDATNLFQAGDSSASAARQSSLTKVTNFPDSYTNLTSAFENCTKLVTGPELGANVTTVTNAFKNCTSLKKLVVYSKSVDMSSAFPGCSDINLYCYKDSAADKAVAGVSDRTYFGEIYTDPPAAVKASAGDSVTVQAQYISDKTNRLTSSVAATWQVNNGGVWENIDTNVSNTTSSHIGTATLTIPDVTLADNGKQFRLYSTDGGSVSEYSSIVTLQIEYGSPATDFVWEFDDAAKTAKVTGYIGAGGDVIVPLSVTGTGEAYGNEYGEYTLGTAGITYTVIDMAAGSRDAGAFSAENKINAGNTGVGNITGVYLPDTLCGEDASFWFYGCTGLTLVDGLPSTITNLSYTYYGCSSLARAPEFPAAAVDLSYTFGECEQLTEVPEIPDTVTVMEDTFFLCKNLVDAPDIPKNVESMEGCFYGCIRLQEPPVIRSTVLKNMRDAFRECGIRTSPVIPDGVTDLSYTFNSCGDMAAVTPIPASVTDMTQTFGSNYELRGDLVVYAKNPTITTILGIGTMYGDLTLYCYKGTTVDTFGQTDRGIAEIRYFGNVTMEMPEEIQAQYGKPVSVTGAYICDEGSSSASVQAHYEVMLPGGQWESAGGRAGFTEQTEDIDGLHKNAVLNIDAEHIVDGMKVRLVATDGNHTFISHEVTVSLDAVISVVVPTKVMFEIDPNVDGAGYTDAAVGSFSNNGGCDVELSVADISGRNGAPLTAYNKYSREEWKNLGRTETENELGFLFQTEGNMLGYIPGQNLTLDELPQGSGQDISYIIAHGNAWTEPKAFVYDITYSVSAIS